jgi:hypothetical protein
MLKTVHLLDNTSVAHISQLWADRYVPDLSTLSLKESQFSISELRDALSPQGRKKTIAKLERMIEIRCQSAGIKTNILFSYIPNVVNLTESRGIADAAAQVYQKILSIYQRQEIALDLLSKLPHEGMIEFSSDVFKSCIPKLSLAQIKELAATLEPALLQFQVQHLSSCDRQTVGFMSTQFHLSAKLVLDRLTISEQLLLSPYFKFVEEQVCIPWQRVCVAAAKHELSSPILSIVQQLLPASGEIAQRVYHRAAQLYPNHSSRRGKLNHPKVKASSIRDIEMFQSYLLLCALEGNMNAVEEELLPLCLMVFPNIDVTWELVEKLLPLLISEIEPYLSPVQMRLLHPYMQAMQEIFSNLETKAAGTIKAFFMSA